MDSEEAHLETVRLLGFDPGTSGPKMMGGAHDAADRYSRSMATWAPPVQTADADILPDKEITDARALDIQRNDAFVGAGSELHKDNIVGANFLLNSTPKNLVLGLDETWAEEFQQEVEEKFTAWAESTENWPDASRHNTLTGLVRLAVGVHMVSGEVLATAEWMRDTPRPFQTAVQMIELPRLSDPGDQPFDQARTRGGVRLNSYGAPVGYYIRRGLAGVMTPYHEPYKWSYVRARNSIGRPQVIHIVDQKRPAQTRGISQLVAALKEMRITKRFRELTLQNAAVNASYAAAIESELPSAQVFESIGGGNVGESITGFASEYLGAISAYSGSARNMQIDGVKIPHLFPGTKLSMMPMGKPGGVGSDFEKALLRYIAANLGVSYEQLSKDYSETNYSSARAGMVETWKAMSAKKRQVADRFATTIYRLWLEEALNMGQIESMPANAPSLYDGLNLEAYTSCEWIGAARGQIDELKETQASILRLKQGLSTWEDELGRQGKDWRKVFSQLRRERDRMAELGIEPTGEDSNAVNAASGDPRENEGDG